MVVSAGVFDAEGTRHEATIEQKKGRMASK
jgi:hypothetical protein